MRSGFRFHYATLIALFAIDMVVFMDRSVLAAVLVPVKERFGLSDTAAGFLVTVFTVSYCVTLPVVGWLSDRVLRKHLLAVGIGIWSLTSLATGLAQNWEQLLIARALTGIGEATCAPIGPTLIADCFPRGQRSRALAVLFMAIPIGSALGFGLGGQATLWLDWRWAFILTCLLGAAAAGLALIIDEPQRGSQDADRPDLVQSWSERAGLLRNRAFLLTTLGMAMMVFALVGLNTWAPTFLTKLRGLSLDEAGTYLGILVAVAGIGGAALGGWLGDRLSRRSPASLPWLITTATVAAAPCLALALWATHPALVFGFLGLGLTLICFNVGPLDTLLIQVTGPRIRGAAFALNVLAIHLLGEMPAPLVVGAVSDWTGSLTWGLALTVGALLLAGAIYGAGARLSRNGEPSPTTDSKLP
jgi:predicted MFS family arabinose efflux permease